MSYAMLGLCLVVLVGLVSLVLSLQSVPVTEQRRRLSGMLRNWPADTTQSFVATEGASTTLTAVSSFAGLEIGMVLSGLGIVPGTTIVAMDSGASTITMSAAGGGVHVGITIVASWATSSAQVHLFAAPFAGGDDPVPGDFTEATFDTYAALPITTGQGPYTNPDGSAEMDFGDFGWVLFATPGVGNTIYGYWIDYLFPAGGATRVVACWETFAAPIVMTTNGQAVVISIPIKLPEPGSVSIP